MLMFILFLTGLFAGTVDAIAGGGGLISLPMLLSIGLPPHLAFGTNKVQGTIGTFVATVKYYRHGYICLKGSFYAILFGVAGSIIGAIAAQKISAEVLQVIIPVLLFVILIYTVMSPRLGHVDSHPRMSQALFYPIFGFTLALYDGFFGPGTGSFWVFALTYFLGFNLIKATAYTKLFNLNSSFVAMVCFMIGGNVDYRLALCMAAGQILGGRFGAHLAIKNGARLIRPLFFCIVSLTIATLGVRRLDHSEAVIAIYLLISVLMLAVAYIYFRRYRSAINWQ